MPFCPFWGEGSPTKTAYRKKVTLTFLLEDLVIQEAPTFEMKAGCRPSAGWADHSAHTLAILGERQEPPRARVGLRTTKAPRNLQKHPAHSTRKPGKGRARVRTWLAAM